MAEFYVIIDGEKFFSDFFFGGGSASAPAPVSYAYNCRRQISWDYESKLYWRYVRLCIPFSLQLAASEPNRSSPSNLANPEVVGSIGHYCRYWTGQWAGSAPAPALLISHDPPRRRSTARTERRRVEDNISDANISLLETPLYSYAAVFCGLMSETADISVQWYLSNYVDLRIQGRAARLLSPWIFKDV